jgi:hypothetical protein
VCVCVCVCVRERGRERERKGERERGIFTFPMLEDHISCSTRITFFVSFAIRWTSPFITY